MIFEWKRTAIRVAREQLAQAEILALEHQAAADYHQAVAQMYAQRAERLRAMLDTEPVPLKVAA